MAAAVEVRRLRPDEGALLRDLRLRALTDSPRAFGSSLEAERDLPGEQWAGYTADAERPVFVADADAGAAGEAGGGPAIGMAGGRWFDDERRVVAIWGMWVDPTARGTGAGAALVGAVREWAAGGGARFVRLGAVAGPGGATGFYERLGFVAIGNERRLGRDESIPWWEMIRPA